MRLGAVMQSYERETDVLEVVIAPDSFVYTGELVVLSSLSD
jgi:hypothetical protein